MSSPDLIFIVLDTQRADRLGTYGYTRPITPNLDRFAGRGVVFEQAIAPAQWTIPSHASMFTGLYPTAHQVTQSSHSLSPDVPHLAEVMRAAGYETIGFCNNPLVGILDNGFKRGFDTFYNYGGAIPSVPKTSVGMPWPLNWLIAGYTQFLRRISYPIQNFFGQSDLAFRVSLNAWLTPLWSRLANFKGQNERSVLDVVRFLQQREKRAQKRPLFLFLNLMETHLPFMPPGEFIDQVAPYFRKSKEARTILRTWNREAYRWAAPLAEPLGELESQVLSDLYDAEVAYQDRYLGYLFEILQQRQNHDDTLTVIVADHGDGLGEHGYFGHAFVAYQELVHVPLLLHWPAQLRPGRAPDPVSTRRVFHTLLGALPALPEMPGLNAAEVRGLSLTQAAAGRDVEEQTAVSEVYPPLNFVKAIQQRNPALLERFRCLAMRRAVVQAAGGGSAHKLIHVDDVPDELFDVGADPLEMRDLLPERPLQAAALGQTLARTVSRLGQQRSALQAGQTIDPEADQQLLQRLRGLGYID
ncbi:MAG: sulfatase [Anaerolineales bacterium]|nr:sulfatase [Anaerolineales bacterium]